MSLAFVKGATDVLLGGHFPHVIDNNHFEIISLPGYDYRIDCNNLDIKFLFSH